MERMDRSQNTPHPLNEPQTRLHTFQQSIQQGLHYWQTWIETHQNNPAALDPMRPGILRCLAFALKSEVGWPQVYTLIEQVAPHMERRGPWETWEVILRQALETAQTINDSLSHSAALYALLGRLLRRQSRFRESIVVDRRAIRLARQIGDRFAEGRACTNLGYAFIEYGHWLRGDVLCRHAMSLFRQIESRHGQAHTANHLGLLYTRQGHYDQAQKHLNTACQLWRQMGDTSNLLSGLINLSVLHNDMARPELALTTLQEAIDLAETHGETHYLGKIYNNLGVALLHQAELDRAESYAQQAERVFHQLGDVQGLAEVWHNLGFTYLARQDYRQAETYFKQSLQTWQQVGNRYGEVRTLLQLTTCSLAMGQPQPATQRLKQAEAILDQNRAYRQYATFEAQVIALRRGLDPDHSKTTNPGGWRLVLTSP